MIPLAGKSQESLKTRVSIVYLQHKFDEISNYYKTQISEFLAKTELKNNPLLEKAELTHCF